MPTVTETMAHAVSTEWRGEARRRELGRKWRRGQDTGSFNKTKWQEREEAMVRAQDTAACDVRCSDSGRHCSPGEQLQDQDPGEAEWPKDPRKECSGRAFTSHPDSEVEQDEGKTTTGKSARSQGLRGIGRSDGQGSKWL